jgi:hypothetical protein
MKTHHCTCGQLLFFENVLCMKCGRDIGFLPDLLMLSSLDPAGGNLYAPTAFEAGGRRYKKCLNYAEEAVCNWMIPEEKSRERFCTSCRLDQIIPDLTDERNWTFWRLIENGKRRLVYSLLSLKLPVLNKIDDPKVGMSFRFLEQSPNSSKQVLTGHDDGIITLNISEADDVERERRRLSMKEPYRTILGHFRHEVGHYYWDRLVAGTKYLEPFRALFGDERADYNEALANYYATGAPEDWQDNFVSVYATSHPWEDWAETWAHYLHIQDSLEVALDFGLIDQNLRLEPREETEKTDSTPPQKNFEEVIEAWSRLTIALNSLNRSMGLRDIYPFILSRSVVEKIRFIAEVIAGCEVTLPQAANASIRDGQTRS